MCHYLKLFRLLFLSSSNINVVLIKSHKCTYRKVCPKVFKDIVSIWLINLYKLPRRHHVGWIQITVQTMESTNNAKKTTNKSCSYRLMSPRSLTETHSSINHIHHRHVSPSKFHLIKSHCIIGHPVCSSIKFRID